jgi:hypothetical protein
MVDALRRAREWVTPQGCVIDVHPTAIPAILEVGNRRIGALAGGDAPERHARASEAVTSAIDAGLFTVAAEVDFLFYTYGDSIGELRDFIADHWRSTRITEELVEQVESLRADPSAGSPRVVERVRLTALRVCS